MRIFTAAGYIGASGDEDGIMEQIVSRTILLKDNHDVLQNGRSRQNQHRRVADGCDIRRILSCD
jgi:hypothetical protein